MFHHSIHHVKKICIVKNVFLSPSVLCGKVLCFFNVLQLVAKVEMKAQWSRIAPFVE